MARVIPIDIIKGISGKYGENADFYFATNTSSGKIRISQLPKPSHRPPTEKQKAQRLRFAARNEGTTESQSSQTRETIFFGNNILLDPNRDSRLATGMETVD